jgi:UDP-N-acetylglucosamine--N-acetylmuramyl-(pentapeptide) pyrophosphoryl-undecaprenol N-acetylglucosamine transferase
MSVVVFAGGGTGGHVYPGLALLSAIREQSEQSEFHWIGTRGRVEERAVPLAGIDLAFLDVAFLKGRRGAALVRAAAGLPRAVAQAGAHLRRWRADAVIGLGGFVSGPVCVAAAALGIPVFILEQNAQPGMTNRAAGKVAKHVYVCFDEAIPHFPAGRATVAGNPVRAELLALAGTQSRAGVSTPPRVLVFGGSQGARVLNENAAGLFARLKASGVAADVWHISGPGAVEKVRASWDAAGVVARVDSYVDDMGAAYEWADLVVCRAGATSIAELTALGLPALYVPFPLAADDHQTANARAVVQAGGGLMVRDDEFSTGRAERLLSNALRNPDVLQRMGEQARRLGRPDAASWIARDILEKVASGVKV